MAFLDNPISVSELPESRSYDLLPEGWYNATITSADLKPTKAGDGQYISMAYDITGPTHQGRKVFGNVTVRNSNPKAEEIGRQQLGDIMRAVGLATVRDTDELIGGQLSIKVSVRRDEQWGDKNDVKGYRAVTGSAAPVPPYLQEKAPAATQATAKAAPPWAKR
jgi:hypothetical protein